MSDPAMIKGIQEAVTIPVMAKARIGHFAEAQVLEALEVDYIDESEVLTPADEAHHIDKWAFKVPFVCGATNLGEALRRIGEGAAMIRSKGEAGTGDIVEAVRHLRTIRAAIRRLQTLDDMELATAAKELQSPLDLVRGVGRGRQAAGRALLRGRDRHPGRRVAGDAARRRGRVRGLGHLQVRGPGDRARAAIVEATTHFKDPERVARASEGLGNGDALARDAQARRGSAARQPRLVSALAPGRRPRPAGRLRGPLEDAAGPRRRRARGPRARGSRGPRRPRDARAASRRR